MKAKNISGRRIKVEYGFNKIRRRELLEPNQIIEIDSFDYDYLSKLGVFNNRELAIINESLQLSEFDKMQIAKMEAEKYINNNN